MQQKQRVDIKGESITESNRSFEELQSPMSWRNTAHWERIFLNCDRWTLFIMKLAHWTHCNIYIAFFNVCLICWQIWHVLISIQRTKSDNNFRFDSQKRNDSTATTTLVNNTKANNLLDILYDLAKLLQNTL